jgi:SAM-dependent methyltransferase
MTQNIYDDPTFYEGYARLRRSVEGLEGAPEWASLRALLPEIRGRRVVDLGCGYGWFCRWVHEQGAIKVIGLDVSEKMLAQAKATSDPEITYARADLEGLALPSGPFDLAYSSLAFHYIADLGRLFAEIHRALAPGGCLIFSIEHPIYMAPSHPQWGDWSRRPRDLAARRLSCRRPAHDGLACQGRSQAPSHDRNHSRFADPRGVHALSRRRMGPDGRTDQCQPGMDQGTRAANVLTGRSKTLARLTDRAP